MPTSYASYGCTKRVTAGSGISFHRFPFKNPDFLQKWLQAVRRKIWIPNKDSFICDHILSSLALLYGQFNLITDL